MIVLKISNASELIAANLGGIVERLTPDQFDNNAVEDQVVEKMVESLALKGLEGEIFIVNGIDVNSENLIISERMKIKKSLLF